MSIEATRPATIASMFGQIAARYDRVNDVLSLGIHRRWRRKMVGSIPWRAGDAVLDCATGTGDVAFALERRAGTQLSIRGVDFCEPMLAVARGKARGRGSHVQFELADVMSLPYPDARFDYATISFGIRNTRDPAAALREMARVIKPGGQVVVLEFGRPTASWIAAPYDLYSRRILPRIGGWVSGRREAYRYLDHSSARFPSGQEFVGLAGQTGCFSQIRVKALSAGIAYIYRLTRAPAGSI